MRHSGRFFYTKRAGVLALGIVLSVSVQDQGIGVRPPLELAAAPAAALSVRRSDAERTEWRRVLFPAGRAEAGVPDVALETGAFLDRCRQMEEIFPDAWYERLTGLCRGALEEFGGQTPARAALLLDEVEIYTFWALDGYLTDQVKVWTARSLLNDCEEELKASGLWEADALLTSRALYLRASIHMLEAHRRNLVPDAGDVLPLLERACGLLAGTGLKEEIVVLHTLGRALVDLAFAADTPEDRSIELMEKASSTFEKAISLSRRRGDFMLTTLMAQLGNTLNNMGLCEAATATLREALTRVGPSSEPNRFLELHLDIAQALTDKYLETLSDADLDAAGAATDRAFLVSNSLNLCQIVPHVRFNLAMTLFTLAQETRDPRRNEEAIFEMEKTFAAWSADRQPDLYLLAVDGLGRFLDEQESMTRDRRSLDRGIAIIGDVLARENEKHEKHEKNAKNEAGAFRA
ncbi:MAG: hypothetical protein LBQ90_00110, partial [Synergistaceae bacterium]|nr:hypothetical protein [Synergistaceae bacterium]